MSGTNRFMSPVKTQYIQTAVDQHVPMPFELMQKRAESEQKHFDTNKANLEALQQKMGEDMLTVDNPMQEEGIGQLLSQFNTTLEEYGGDYRKMDDDVRRMGNEYNRFMTTGVGSIGKGNKQLHDANAKALADSDMTGERQDRYLRAGELTYNNSGGAIEGVQYKAFAPSPSTAGLADAAIKIAHELKPDQYGKAFAGYIEGDSLIAEDKWTQKVLGLPDVRHAIQKRVYGDQNWMGETKQDFRVAQALGDLPEGIDNITDYRDMAFKTRFLGIADAEAYSQYDPNKKVKESAETKAGATSKKGPLIPITKSGAVGIEPSAQTTHFADTENKTPGESTAIFRKNTIDGVFSNVVDAIRTDSNLGTSAEVYQVLNEATGGNYDFSLDADKEQFTRDIVTGVVDLDKAISSGLVPNTIISQAETAQQAISDDEQWDIDIMKDMLYEGAGGVTQEMVDQKVAATERRKLVVNQNKQILKDTESTPQQKTYAASSTKLLEMYEKKAKLVVELDQLKKEDVSLGNYLWGASTEEADKIETQLKYLNDSVFTLESTMQGIAKSGVVSQDAIDVVKETRKHKDDKYTLGLMQEELDTRKKKIAEDTRSSRPSITGVPLSTGTSNLSQKAIDDINTEIQNDPTLILDAEVTYGNNERGPVRKAIEYEADQLIAKDQLTDETRPSYITRRTKELTQGIPRFANADVDPEHMSMVVGGKYLIQLGTGNTEFNIPGIKENRKPTFKANSWAEGQLVRAVGKPGKVVSVDGMKGVKIKTPMADGSGNTSDKHELVITPYLFGIKDRKKDVVVPQSHAKRVLVKLEQWKLEASTQGGKVDVDGKLVPLQEVQQSLIKKLYKQESNAIGGR